MTYKYEEVKRELWKKKPDKIISPRRSIRDIRNTISFRFWILLSISILSLIAAVVLFLFRLYNYYMIPLCIDVITIAISEWLGEKNYNETPRRAELEKQKSNYPFYLNNVKKIFQDCGIETDKQIDCLKAEARNAITKFENRFSSAEAKIKDLLIAIPLAALLELFWKQKTEVDPINLTSFIILGLFCVSSVYIGRSVYIHISAIKKDYYLLRVLLEMDYQEKQENEQCGRRDGSEGHRMHWN